MSLWIYETSKGNNCGLRSKYIVYNLWPNSSITRVLIIDLNLLILVFGIPIHNSADSYRTISEILPIPISSYNMHKIFTHAIHPDISFFRFSNLPWSFYTAALMHKNQLIENTCHIMIIDGKHFNV